MTISAPTQTADRLTLAELCVLLDVTPPWVGKTLQFLNLERQGRGRERLFASDEISILRHTKMLRLCGVLWEEIQEVRKQEQKVRKEIESLYPENAFGNKGAVLTRIRFALNEPSRCFIPESSLQKGLEQIKVIMDRYDLKRLKERMQSKMRKFQEELSRTTSTAEKFYEPSSGYDSSETTDPPLILRERSEKPRNPIVPPPGIHPKPKVLLLLKGKPKQ